MTTGVETLKDPPYKGLYRSSFEHDACGVGMICNLSNRKNHTRVQDALKILAMGFVGPEPDTLVAQLGLAVDARGNLSTGSDFMTSRPGVFATGDARRGQSLLSGLSPKDAKLPVPWTCFSWAGPTCRKKGAAT